MSHLHRVGLSSIRPGTLSPARTGDMIMISYLRRLGSKYDVVGVRPWNGANSYHSEHCF